jgi:hypothetical protein
MGVGAAVVRADWVAFLSPWEAPTSRDRGDGRSDVEASGEMDVVAGACSSCGGLWRRDRW